MLRYGSLFAAGFLQGFGNAYASYMYNGCPPNSPCFVINTGSSNNNSNSLPPTQSAVYQGLGQVGTNLSGVMMQNFNTAPTVTLNQGTGMGILFMQDVSK
jgi:intracellular multiplication protein IcmE